MTFRLRRSAGRTSAVLGAISFGTSLAVVASASAFLILFADQQPAASTKQTAPAEGIPLPRARTVGIAPYEQSVPPIVTVAPQQDPAEPIEAAPERAAPSEDASAPAPGQSESIASHLVPGEAPTP